MKNREALVVGDLNGSAEAFFHNLSALGVLRPNRSTGVELRLEDDQELIFLGDILADRFAKGIPIVQQILEMRRKLVRVTALWGNHEVFAARLLMGTPLKAQYAGMVELLKLHPEADRIFDKEVLNATIGVNGKLNLDKDKWVNALLRFSQLGCRKEALATEKGKAVSQYLIESKLYYESQHKGGRTLYFHTPPTAIMLRFVMEVGETLNHEFSQWTNVLLEGTASQADLQRAKTRWTRDAGYFLNTETRLPTKSRPDSDFPDERDLVWQDCKEAGIQRIIFGHHPQSGPICIQRGPIACYPIDMACHGWSGPYSSTATVRNEGVWVSGQNL